MNRNPLYQEFGRLPQAPEQQNFLSRLQQFRQTVKGNPQQIVQQMLNSGRITQEQFNQAAQMANQMMRYIR